MPWTQLRAGTALVLLAAAIALTWGCSKKIVAPLQLDAGRLTVTNTTRNDWTHVEIWVNRQYRLTTDSIPAGQQLQAPLSIFIEAYGQRFDFKRQQIRDLRLSAKLPNGEPVDVRMDLKGNGLAGLAGVGVFKGNEGKE
jgi:hypothetical protein